MKRIGRKVPGGAEGRMREGKLCNSSLIRNIIFENVSFSFHFVLAYLIYKVKIG